VGIYASAGVAGADQRGEEEADSGSLRWFGRTTEAPNTAASGQRPKKWIEEEIDEGQDSGKAAKVGGKDLPITEIDEEDLEDSELDINTAVRPTVHPSSQTKSSTDWTGVTGDYGSSTQE